MGKKAAKIAWRAIRIVAKNITKPGSSGQLTRALSYLKLALYASSLLLPMGGTVILVRVSVSHGLYIEGVCCNSYF